MSNNEKRAHLRKSLQTPAWISELAGDDWDSINLLDVSVAGAAFLVNQALPDGATRRFRFCLPDNAQPITFSAQVMNCTQHTYLAGYRAGVKIADIGAGDRALIAQFIALPITDTA